MTPVDPLESLFSRACDGSASAEDARELADRLAADREALDAWIRYTDLHASLATSAWPHKMTKPIPLAKLRSWPAQALALAASILLMGALLWLVVPSDSNKSGSLAGVELEVLDSSEPAWSSGQTRRVSELKLDSGALLFRLSSGVAVAALGPVELQLLSPMRLRVMRGKVTADVGEHGKGFIVDTASASVLDLGTVFGVEVGAGGETDVVVFSGQVQVHEPTATTGSPLLASLNEGEAVRVDKLNKSSRIECVFIEPRREEWTTQPPGPEAVITDVRDNLENLGARGCYRVVIGGMKAGVTLRRTHPLRWLPAAGESLPPWLEGADVVETANADAQRADFQMTLTLARPAILYVLHDDRQPVPDWLRERFTDTHTRLLLERAREVPSVRPFSVWKMAVPQAGEVVLGPQFVAGQVNQGRAYRLAAKALR